MASFLNLCGGMATHPYTLELAIHELRNILSSLLMSSSLLKKNLEADFKTSPAHAEVNRKLAETIREATRRMDSLLRELMQSLPREIAEVTLNRSSNERT